MSPDEKLSDSHVLAQHAIPVPLTSMSFRTWPIVHERTRVWPVLVGVLVVTVAVGVSTDSLGWALTAVTLFALALWRMLLPIYFELSQFGITQRALGRRWSIPWAAIRGYEIHGQGIVLLSRSDDSPVGRLGGIYIPWSAYRSELLELVDRHMAARYERGGSSTLEREALEKASHDDTAHSYMLDPPDEES